WRSRAVQLSLRHLSQNLAFHQLQDLVGFESCSTTFFVAVECLRHARHAVDLAFDRNADVGDGRGAGARIAGGDVNGWRRDVRVLVDRQPQHGHDPDQHGHDRDHGGEDRALDEEFGEHRDPYPPGFVVAWPSPALAGASAAGLALGWGATLLPGTARCSPSTMTRSSPVRPLATTP